MDVCKEQQFGDSEGCLALMMLKKEPCQESFMLKASTVLLAVLYDTPSVHLLKKDLTA